MTRSLFAPALLASALLAAAPAFAQQKVVPAQSEISFTSHQMGVPVDGKFRTWDAQIAFDPKKPEAGKVSFTIDTGSATFGVPETDAEVPKAPWFNAAKFPKATFQSTAIKATGKGQYAVSGQLTVKGASQPVVVPVTLKQAGATTTATGTFAIKRLDFKIGEGEWADTSTVANNVEVHFKLTVTGVGAL
ncbi:YceI family protein [Ideonella oryzae]|uniref:YceI family protein n=1 Tax=Ideonella oryzae TaxID=2937441 RepID=A0ABT1BPQ7_9BURK|nr:YceI family protein [Ideonella oryzae]MCO5978204.1 YceI family protein [Ideonella oryzae]